MMRFIRNMCFVFFGGLLSYFFGNHYGLLNIPQIYAMWSSTFFLCLFIIGVFGLLGDSNWKL